MSKNLSIIRSKKGTLQNTWKITLTVYSGEVVCGCGKFLYQFEHILWLFVKLWTDLDQSGPIGKMPKKSNNITQYTICEHHADIILSLNTHKNALAPAVDLVNIF